MTFSTMERPEVKHERKAISSKPLKVGEALQRLVKEAFIHDRLLYGFLECAQFLKKNPRSVAMCITQRSPSAHSELINRKLLEAFCTEKNVRLVQVDSCKKLTRYIDTADRKQKDVRANDHIHTQDAAIEGTCASLGDAECLIIKQADVKSLDEDFVVTYHDFALYSTVLPCPYITVPE